MILLISLISEILLIRFIIIFMNSIDCIDSLNRFDSIYSTNSIDFIAAFDSIDVIGFIESIVSINCNDSFKLFFICMYWFLLIAFIAWVSITWFTDLFSVCSLPQVVALAFRIDCIDSVTSMVSLQSVEFLILQSTNVFSIQLLQVGSF